MRLIDHLKDKLTEDELSHLKKSFDVIGSIAIIEIPPELQAREKIIGEALMAVQKNVRTVARKVGVHSGRFRLQRLKIIAGDETKETEYKESGVRLKLDVEKVYFSPRLSTERKRIADLVKKDESVLVMFSGCAPYVCVIAKNARAKVIYGIEINPTAHRYGEQNLRLNKISNARLFLGDVKTISPKLKKKFDRIIMPLPRSAEDFLKTAIKAGKKGTTIHFYDFEHESDLPKKSIEKVRKAMGRKKFKVIGITRCGEYAPRKWRVCVDFRIL